MGKRKKTILMILDGWGVGDGSKADLITQTNTPNYDRYLLEYPNSKLKAAGTEVGLPNGQMGNSEVGHLNIGAGRVVYQDLVKINNSIEDKSFFDNEKILNAVNYAKKNNKAVHLLGLVSPGGVHSMHTHLFALIKLFKEKNIPNTYVHALTDGRDTDPKSGLSTIKELLEHLKNSDAKLASLCGRYYTMDRDKRWDRIKKAYDLLVHGKGTKSDNIIKSVKESYESGVTDEFIEPIVMVDKDEQPIAKINSGDVVICFNFRTDRLRQITTVLTQSNMPEYDMKTLPLEYHTMTNYDKSFKNIKVIFDKEDIKSTIGEQISAKGLKQLRIAETEKYAHVTFFFNGGREESFDNEDRELVPSPKVKTYDLMPEMSAYKVKDKLVDIINNNIYDFICVNFANCDMVGHTGVHDAIVKAVKTVDDCMGQVVDASNRNNYQTLIIADHGNADYAINDDDSPNTAHSLNEVPCILIGSKYKKISNGKLADVAPSLLKLMDIEIPEEMTGNVLIED